MSRILVPSYQRISLHVLRGVFFLGSIARLFPNGLVGTLLLEPAQHPRIK